MADIDFSKQELQLFIGQKISAFTNPLEFNGALMNLIEIKKGWSPEKMINRMDDLELVEGVDYTIDHNKNNQLLINMKTFKATNAIGSKMWCISREEPMFARYKRNTLIDYKFYFDFNMCASDDMSMIAILSTMENKISEIYTKGDKEFLKDKKKRFVNDQSKKEALIFLKKLMNETYKNDDLSYGHFIKKIGEEDFMDYNPIKNDLFTEKNSDQLIQLLENSTDWSKRITKEDYENNKDLFETREGDFPV